MVTFGEMESRQDNVATPDIETTAGSIATCAGLWPACKINLSTSFCTQAITSSMGHRGRLTAGLVGTTIFQDTSTTTESPTFMVAGKDVPLAVGRSFRIT